MSSPSSLWGLQTVIVGEEERTSVPTILGDVDTTKGAADEGGDNEPFVDPNVHDTDDEWLLLSRRPRTRKIRRSRYRWRSEGVPFPAPSLMPVANSDPTAGAYDDGTLLV